jgi:heme-degrading monooxygenase HmoA
MGYCEIWQFDVPPGQCSEFESAYDAGGVWAVLFAKAEGFAGIEFLRSTEVAGRYCTIDRWESEEAFRAFKATFAREYADLDATLEHIAGAETRIGAFTTNG